MAMSILCLYCFCNTALSREIQRAQYQQNAFDIQENCQFYAEIQSWSCQTDILDRFQWVETIDAIYPDELIVENIRFHQHEKQVQKCTASVHLTLRNEQSMTSSKAILRSDVLEYPLSIQIASTENSAQDYVLTLSEYRCLEDVLHHPWVDYELEIQFQFENEQILVLSLLRNIQSTRASLQSVLQNRVVPQKPSKHTPFYSLISGGILTVGSLFLAVPYVHYGFQPEYQTWLASGMILSGVALPSLIYSAINDYAQWKNHQNNAQAYESYWNIVNGNDSLKE
jgi:hypothetical protein